MSEETTPIPAETEQDETPAGQAKRWKAEIHAAREWFEDFHREGDEAIEEYLGKNGSFNLYHADADAKSAMLSGIPNVRVRRRFADADDDPARVGSEIVERILSTDLEHGSDGFRRALNNAKGDWIRPGLGVVRFRLTADTEPIDGGERLADQDVETDYVKWRRFLYSPGEVWEDVRWIAYGLDVSRKDWAEQFPKHEFHPEGKDAQTERQKDDARQSVKATAPVWEIWCKESRTVYFLSEQHDTILKAVPDTWELPNFFPSPVPLMSSVTTSKCIPKSLYQLAKPQYDEAHEIQKRIRDLVKRAVVAGVYNSANEALAHLLENAADGKLTPAKHWTMEGDISSAIAFIPLGEIRDTILGLSERLALVKQEIYEITAQSDLMRGVSDPREKATTSRVKARFGSSRIQAEQDEFARFASEGQRIRAFLICKHFSPELLIKRSAIDRSETIEVPVPAMMGKPSPGMMRVPNRKLIDEAIELLKSDFMSFRIDVDADSVSLTDYDSVRQERIEALTALGGYFQQSQALLQASSVAGPQVVGEAAKLVINSARWLVAGLKGSSSLESDFDRFADAVDQAAQQPKPPPPPDPELEAVKAQAEAKVQGAQIDMAGKRMDLQLKTAEHGMKMREMQADAALDTAKTRNDLARAAAAPQVQPPV